MMLPLVFVLAATVAPLPSGTVPMYVPDPVLPADPATPVGFGCLDGCGPSCDCVGRVDAEVTTTFEGKVCRWATIECRTHSFCRWHDGCYRSCDFQFPGRVDDGVTARTRCYRACDIACSTGVVQGPEGGWRPPDLEPGPPPETLGIFQCLKRLLFSDAVPYDGVVTYARLLECR